MAVVIKITLNAVERLSLGTSITCPPASPHVLVQISQELEINL